MKTKTRLVTMMVATTLVLTAAGGASAAPRSGRVRVSADVSCVVGGGVALELTMTNPGTSVVRIDPDFHVLLEIIRQGRQPGVVLFVFPAPTHSTIPPGESRSFLLELGTPEPPFPGLDVSGARLILETETWLAGRTAPVVKTFSFPAC